MSDQTDRAGTAAARRGVVVQVRIDVPTDRDVTASEVAEVAADALLGAMVALGYAADLATEALRRWAADR